ncbi:hypothetical protein [Streptomyces sp. NPDC058092]|uniref:hypothetical protein n=1 Tax=Streptomyces sp. NPDC058092 TaxID=3346336 RepID=UPI0036E76B71
MNGPTAVDRGNLAFWTLVSVSVAIRAVVVYVACCLAMAITWQFTHHGRDSVSLGSVWAGGLLLALSAVGGVRSTVRL